MLIKHQIHEAITAELANLAESTRRSWRAELDVSDPNKGWQHQTTYTFTNGETVELNGKSYSELLFPASPGFERLKFTRPESGAPAFVDITQQIEREPIIGWSSQTDNCQSWIEPITISEAGMTTTGWNRLFKAIKFPDGRIEWGGPFPLGTSPGTILADEAAWMAEIERVWTIQLEQETEEEKRRKEAGKPCPRCGVPRLLDAEIPF